LLLSESDAFTTRHVDEVANIIGKPVMHIDGEMVSCYGRRSVSGLRYLAELRRLALECERARA